MLCTGTYFATRVVVTAAHCRGNDAIPGQTFVYYGKDYLDDVASLPDIPGRASHRCGHASRQGRCTPTTTPP